MAELMSRKTSFDGAEEKGRQAARDGLPITACPYKDKRKPSGKLSWSRAYRNAWRMGWQTERINLGLHPC